MNLTSEGAADLQQTIADLQRQLAERTVERDESEAQKAALAEVLAVINSSPGDLAPVFDAILEKAHSLCGADHGALVGYDGEYFKAIALRAMPEAFAALLREPFRSYAGGVQEGLLAGDPVVHVRDVAGRTPTMPIQRAAIDSGIRTLLMVPLRRDDILLGYITAHRREVRPFTDKQIALLQSFAAQAVIAMENARLLTETREALDQQTATSEVLEVINTSPGDLAPVFDAILEKAHNLCGADNGTLLTYDGDRFWPAAWHGGSQYLAYLAEARSEGIDPAIAPSFGRLVRGARLDHVHDMEELAARVSDDALRRRLAALVQSEGVRTQLVVALRRDDVLLGALTANRKAVQPFSDKQIALLQNFAAQAVVAIENARLLTETREALEQQTATAEVLGVINSSPADLNPVFDAILEKAHTLCGAAHGSLITYDGEFFRAAALHDMAEPLASRLREPFRSTPGDIRERLLQGEPLIHVPDIALLEARNPEGRAALDAGVRTLLIVPLRKDHALLGYITANRREVRPFTEKQIALLQNFAAQAVIAMENARLITETREALEQQTATAEVLGVINSSPGDLVPVFESMLEKATRLCDAAFGQLWTYDGQRFQLVATRNLPAELADFLAGAPPEWFRTVSHQRLLAGAPLVHVPDIATDETYQSGDQMRRAAVELGKARSLLSVPLRKDATLLGVFSLFRHEPRSFTEKQIALVENFAAQAVIAIDNARLITETRAALEQQTATAEVLGVINSSPGNLAPVFDAMLERAMRLCEGACGHLYSYDGESFHPEVVNAEPHFVEWWRRFGPVKPNNNDAPLGRLAGGERVVKIGDARDERGYRTAPGFREMVDNSGIRSGVTVALEKDETLRGAITIYRREVKPFTDRQIALLQNFAAQAVIAMENARLLSELRQRNDEIASWNKELEDRVTAQLGELERVGKLKRFLAPQLAELIVARGDEGVLETHRRDIVVVFCDLRDFTAFAETAEPEEVLDLLREYHAALGPIVSASEGTLDHFSGDGIMVFFNDPVPVADASERAVKMAIEMREAMAGLQQQWRRQGRRIGFGAGIARGYATLGQIGFADRIDYTAIGTVCNLAARLCAEAKDGQILVSQRVAAAVEETMPLEEIGEVALKGLSQPVAVYNVPLAGGPAAALRVIDGGGAPKI